MIAIAAASAGAMLAPFALIGVALGIDNARTWLVDFHDRHTNTSPLPIRPARQPIAALTARPHHEAVDELGPWNPSRHQLMPALLAGETFVNGVNTEVTA